MAEHPLPLATFYKGWDTYQGHLVHVLGPLSPEQLALQAAPHLRSIGSNAAHIIGARAGWLSLVLGEPDECLVELRDWDEPGQPDRSAAELVSGLEQTWQVLQNGLARWTPDDLDQTFHYIPTDGGEESYTLQWVLWHLIEHDLHHGGEISFSLGMHNIPAIDL